jgi:alkylation response protein AidB-like acyl-CoA dehydrogenase
MTIDHLASANDWLVRMRALAPTVREWRDAAERERHLPQALCAALRDAGVFKMSTPRAHGGCELDEICALGVIEELSRQDGSVGWNAMVASNTATIASYLGSEGLKTLYKGGPSTVVAGALLPKGSAQSIPGGYRLSGRWTLASGCHQADWMVACSVVLEQGKPRLHADGRPDIRTFFLPASQCEILDTWHTAGMRGTGSHDWQVAEVFVPEALSFPIFLDGARQVGGLFVRDFAAYAVARVAAVALGIARDAIESLSELARTKVPTVGTSTLATQHVTHDRLGRAEALLRAARSLLYETVRALPYSPSWSTELDDGSRAAIRLAGAHAAESAAQAVDLMFNLAGTAGIYTSSRLERCFRDVHVAAQHINVAPSNIEMVGQYLLGQGLAFRR